MAPCEQFLANLASGAPQAFVLGQIWSRVILTGQIWGTSREAAGVGLPAAQFESDDGAAEPAHIDVIAQVVAARRSAA